MRDNFGCRVSFGKLSPQGANMMWDSFVVGVAIPRNKRGRGVTLNSDSVPVEIQAFFTPDPAKLDSTDQADWNHLAALRPETVEYERLMVKDPDGIVSEDEDTVQLEPDYFQWAAAEIIAWDSAAASARIEPVRSVGASHLGRDRFVPEAPDDNVTEESAEGEEDGDGYGEATVGPAAELQIGDLLQTDENIDLWGVVVGIANDVVEEDQLAIEYRNLESGEEGLIYSHVRHPGHHLSTP